ncbi:LacI family DNA-binding transcriptional regulator [Mycolicibacterium brisbanense]|uniref:LacI family transcriptional regulator n=1 Tax=Mycolicibacterium brisbanense TaxID=146020 RepID=A0A100W0B8_9MYCO|nr:LacI family DNA-binding transcriptional regulator [Mycolicibacterium brisbanense]MCV7161779.1 LacI family DNA-binding transcriptional regulator [Mycolicibacterium brisbanense]GAS89290.1 LacI family transcriptional regulator [Mycolicibacterium brisbanense]
MREVAAAASVSVGTVSNVLNAPDKVAPATVARVQAAIDQLGFVRNDAARQLKAGRSRSVGLVVLDIGNPFFTDIARAAERRAGEHNLTVLLGTSDDDSDRERAYIDAFDEQRVFGLLVSPVGEDLARLNALRERDTPVVLVDRDGSGTAFDSVAVDDVAGARLAVHHLCAIGRRRIAFVGGPATLRQIRDRRRGAADAVAETPGAQLEIIDTSAPSVLDGRAAGERLRDRAPEDRPDAVFCANDLLAMGVLQALTLMGGVRVPQDVALVGYDDIDFARSAVVPLTSVRQPTAEIGTTAVDLLVEAAEGRPGEPKHVVFQPELIVRDSTAG